MLAMDAKTQKIELGPIFLFLFFMTDESFGGSV